MLQSLLIVMPLHVEDRLNRSHSDHWWIWFYKWRDMQIFGWISNATCSVLSWNFDYFLYYIYMILTMQTSIQSSQTGWRQTPWQKSEQMICKTSKIYDCKTCPSFTSLKVVLAIWTPTSPHLTCTKLSISDWNALWRLTCVMVSRPSTSVPQRYSGPLYSSYTSGI